MNCVVVCTVASVLYNNSHLQTFTAVDRHSMLKWGSKKCGSVFVLKYSDNVLNTLVVFHDMCMTFKIEAFPAYHSIQQYSTGCKKYIIYFLAVGR